MPTLTNTEKKLKNNLICLREKKGYTKYHVAKQCDINYSYYHKLEKINEKISPGFETLEKIAKFYGIEVYELFT